MAHDKLDIKITEIELKNSGPIVNLKKEIRPLTLFYAKNEKGKTTIVENMVSALFSNIPTDAVNIRDSEFVDSKNSVTVIGLEDAPKKLKPKRDNKKKLDSVLADEGGPALPLSLSRLLYVRGAQTDIIDAAGGINRDFLKSAFAGKKVHDEIMNTLKKSYGETGYTELLEGRITGNKKIGDFKKLLDAEEKIEKLKGVSETFHSELSTARITFLDRKIEAGSVKIEEMEQAKKHYAWTVQKKISRIKDTIVSMKEFDLNSLFARITMYFTKKKNTESLKKKLESGKGIEKEYLWLQDLQRRFTEYLETKSSVMIQVIFWAALAMLPVAVVLVFLRPILSVIPMALSAVLLLFYFFMKRKERITLDDEVLAGDGEVFRKHYSYDLDAQSLNRELLAAAENKRDHESLKNELKALQKEIDSDYAEIDKTFQRIVKEKVDEDKWTGTIQKIQENRTKLERELSELEERFRNLEVNESDFIEEWDGPDYSRELYGKYTTAMTSLFEERKGEEESMRKLREGLADFIPADIAFNGTVEDISLAIADRTKVHEAERKRCIVKIISALIVKEIIEEETAREEEVIGSYLNNEGITSLLKKFTGVYSSFKLDGEDIYVVSGDEEYNLKDVSTGTQEQALLALRAGIARQLAGDGSLFFILDDAFQYSDWDRRKLLVDRTIDMVKEGWQVIYFTMDDNIRDLFNDYGKKLGDDYVKIEL